MTSKTSERTIILRKMIDRDLKLKVEWSNDPDINKYIGFDHKINIKETKKWFTQQSKNPNINLFTILLGDESIGFMKLVKDNYNKNGELHMTIGKRQYWGRGYGEKAVYEFLKFCFVKERLYRVFLHVFEWNKRAYNLYKKCGFKHEDMLRNHVKHINGEWHDVMVMGILKEEWERNTHF